MIVHKSGKIGSDFFLALIQREVSYSFFKSATPSVAALYTFFLTVSMLLIFAGMRGDTAVREANGVLQE